LDQSNINNAFVSGMQVKPLTIMGNAHADIVHRRKEDLSLYGNQLNYMQTLWTVGYVVTISIPYVQTLADYDLSVFR
jgi:hypothetical protein